MKIGSLCSGYEGLGAAVQSVLGGDLAWFAEIDPDASKVLAHHWPDVPNLGDLTKVDWTNLKGHLMAWPRCDERAQEMYDLYCQGLSLAQVAERYGVTRQSVHGLFKTRGWQLRQRPTPKPYVEFNGSRYTIGNHGYYRRTDGSRSLMHRDVWEHHRGAIPDGWDIHHRDHDKTNNDITNLECLPKDEHARRYNLGCNGSVHRCGIEEVMPKESSTVDVLIAGFPKRRART